MLKRIFGNRAGDASASGVSGLDSTSAQQARVLANSTTDLYFLKSKGMQHAISQRDFERAGILAGESLQYIEGFVRETRNSFGSFDIQSIPPLEQGGRILALVGDEGGLFQLEAIVEAIPELQAWRAKVFEHWEDLRLFNVIKEAISSHPYCLQVEVKGLVGHNDGHRIATLISYLEKSHQIQRIPDGKTYRLINFDSAYGPPWAPQMSRETDTKLGTNAETILAAEKWCTSSEIAKGRISVEDDGCWLWKGTLNSGGYGRITHTIGGRRYSAPVHQLTWLEVNGGVWPVGTIARHL